MYDSLIVSISSFQFRIELYLFILDISSERGGKRRELEGKNGDPLTLPADRRADKLTHL